MQTFSQSVTEKSAEKHADFFTEFHREVRGKACGLFHRVSQRSMRESMRTFSWSVTEKYAVKHADFFTKCHREVRGKACRLFHKVRRRKAEGDYCDRQVFPYDGTVRCSLSSQRRAIGMAGSILTVTDKGK
ncbi:MAG: hypothetical protein PHN88_01745 [Ignavibacteria bacterium]|nr:hypothetical protein [Ignavibacteria bacterium]